MLHVYLHSQLFLFVTGNFLDVLEVISFTIKIFQRAKNRLLNSTFNVMDMLSK